MIEQTGKFARYARRSGGNTVPKLGPIMQKIEEEEGQPFWTVVRDYAEIGCSRVETARLLGYSSERAFRKLLKNHPEQLINWPVAGQSALFRYMCDQRKIPGSDEHKKVCYAGRKAGEKLAKRYWVDGIYDTAKRHYDRIKPDVVFGTVLWRLRAQWKPELALKLPRITNEVSGRNSRIAAKRKKRGE